MLEALLAAAGKAVDAIYVPRFLDFSHNLRFTFHIWPEEQFCSFSLRSKTKKIWQGLCDPESRSGNTEDLNKKSTKWEAVKSREREREKRKHA